MRTGDCVLNIQFGRYDQLCRLSFEEVFASESVYAQNQSERKKYRQYRRTAVADKGKCYSDYRQKSQ